MNTYNNNERETTRKQYTDEVKQRWGNTEVYKESARKTAGYSAEKMADVNAGLNAVIAEFSAILKNGDAPDSENAQTLVRKLQDYITDNFYTCTKEILAGLGQMYVTDERFKKNIDRNEEGTAKFISKAIECYCK